MLHFNSVNITTANIYFTQKSIINNPNSEIIVTQVDPDTERIENDT